MRSVTEVWQSGLEGKEQALLKWTDNNQEMLGEQRAENDWVGRAYVRAVRLAPGSGHHPIAGLEFRASTPKPEAWHQAEQTPAWRDTALLGQNSGTEAGLQDKSLILVRTRLKNVPCLEKRQVLKPRLRLDLQATALLCNVIDRVSPVSYSGCICEGHIPPRGRWHRKPECHQANAKAGPLLCHGIRHLLSCQTVFVFMLVEPRLRGMHLLWTANARFGCTGEFGRRGNTMIFVIYIKRWMMGTK